ncbi:MAG: hypothetical protein FWC50_00450 [Planctomycetaceae bacterium]|nr:hypothetical protein [Planctomycetaceae bacterium]
MKKTYSIQLTIGIILCAVPMIFVIVGCGAREKKTYRTIAESGFYQDGGKDFGIVFLFNDISTGEYHLAAKAAQKLRDDIGDREGNDAGIRSRLGFAQKQLDEGAECVALIMAWEKQENGDNVPPPNMPPKRGLPPGNRGVKFGFPSDDVFQFDVLTQQLSINRKEKIRFPDCDGKCYLLTKEKTFEPIDLNVKELFRFHCDQYSEEMRANARRSQSGSGGSWSGDNYFHHQNFLYSDDVLHADWYKQLKPELDANRIEIK